MTSYENIPQPPNEILPCQQDEALLCLQGIAEMVRDVQSPQHNEALRVLLRVTAGRPAYDVTCPVEQCRHREMFSPHHFVFDPL